MSRERLLRNAEQDAAFDWQRPARALAVDLDVARALYLRSLQRTDDLGRAEQLYLRWLRTAAARRPEALAPAPGRLAEALGEPATARRARQLRDAEQVSPGKWTRVLLEDRDRGHDHGASLPGRDEVRQAMAALTSDAAALREHLVAAAASGRGTGEALAKAEPATAAAVLRGLRSQGAPVLRLVTGAAGGEVERVLGRGSASTGLPGDVAARLGQHVGAQAAGAARLHTDDAADLVASAHHAQAVTVGTDIYFAQGRYAPGTERGDELLAHELTHVAQGQRGELSRAAAKGLDAGGTLDPAEAEAELRAKLAVIHLHAPDGAASPPAAPSGQPASETERQAKLAAQRQRLAVADQTTALLTAPPAPAATTPQAPVAHTAPEMPAPPAPAPTGNAYVDTLAAPPSKQATERWATAGTQATAEAAADQAQFDASLAPMPVVLDGREAPKVKPGAVAEAAKATEDKDQAAEAQPAEAQPDAAEEPPSAAEELEPTPKAAAPKVTVPPVVPSVDRAQMQAAADDAIAALPTSAGDVNTNPGPAPVTDLSGQADPVRSLGDHRQAVGDGARALDQAKAKVIAGPGAAQVQPAKLDEKRKVPRAEPAGAMPELPTVEGMTKLKKANLPGNVQTAFDGLAKPRMEASLAQAKAKVTEAGTQRDADRSKAVTDTEDKVKAAHADADKQQQAKVAQARAKIANHQSDSLVKHEAEVKKLDQQAGDRKKSTVGKINDRIAADQAKVQSDYQAAQRKALDQKQQGEAEAAKKKKEAEDQKKDKSWWEQLGDAVCDAIQAVADAIGQVLDAIGKAIGQILDAVKDVACKVIDAARDFVCQALSEFGDWLKAAVTAVIGSVFPALAAALNQLIDAAVSAAKAAVNAIADGLKAAVSALCDTLKAAVDAVIAAYKAAALAAATLAKALVTGDWSAVGKMILEGILKLLGIDPEAFYALIGKAMDSIDKIIENPGAFVGHLIDAVKLGFQQFGGNFWEHLKNGLVQWLFGTFAQAGITMPASFDIAGIFDLVCQVLGLTWPRLRGKVAKLIGEQNTERLEFVGKYFQALISGGFSGLWEQIQQDMSSLWDMVIGGVRNWILEKIVQKAILKIATMWNPAGAILQLIETAWNVFCWVRENAQRIFGLVQAVVDSIANIASGNIGGAANYIEESLAKLVPIAISLFANLIGLGGIADKIKGIIEKVQTKIDQAIDKLIRRVAAMFKGKGSAAGAKPKADGKPADGKAKGTIGKTISFVAGGKNAESHKTWIEVAGDKARVMVASTPLPAVQQLANIKKLGVKGRKQQRVVAEAEQQIPVTQAAADARTAAKPDGGNVDALEQKLELEQQHLADRMKAVFDVYLGDFESWFAFKLPDKGTGHVLPSPRFEGHGGGFNPAPTPPDRYKNAYIANVATVSQTSPESLLSPARIGSAYRSAFQDPADLRNRFALVIGVNIFEDLADTAQGKVQSNTSAGVAQDYPWAIVGFTWAQPWQTSEGGTAPIADVRAFYRDLPDERKMLAREYEKRNRATPPFGEVRDVIQQSRFTSQFNETLRARAERVFIQVGDGDVVSLNPTQDTPPYFHRYDALLKRMVDDIPGRARQASARQGDGGLPIIASGGYDLELKAVVGQGGASDVRTVLSTRLDMAVRTAMASVDPGSVYFPEPNFIVQITPETIKAQFGNPKMESRRLAQNAAAAMAGRKPLLLWDLSAILITTAPDRMEIGNGEAMMRQWEQIKPFTAQDLQALFNTSQNHAKRRTWINQVANSYSMNAAKALPILSELYTACFPVDSDQAESFEPVGKLAERLAGWRVDDAQITEIRGKLEAICKSDRPNATADTSGDAATIARRICEVAVAAGDGVARWLRTQLPRLT